MKRVFISFDADDRKRVDGLRLLAANPKFDIEFYDESVRTPYNSDNAAYIRQRIREKIGRASVTLVLVSSDTHKSAWVNWEIEESLKQGNKVIAMGFPEGPDRLVLPPALRALDASWFRWDLDVLYRQIGN